MGHAVGAALIFSSPVRVPIGCIDQLPVAGGVSVSHQIAGSLPTQHRVARNTPCRALKIRLTLEKVEEERGVVQAPFLAALLRERFRKELLSLFHAEEVL